MVSPAQDRFAALLDALAAIPAEQGAITFTFAELEALRGRRLLAMAYRAEYWTTSYSARKNWLRLGWRAQLAIEARTVTFTRAPVRRPPVGPQVAWFRVLAAQLSALPEEQQVIAWTIADLSRQLGRRLPRSVRLPYYWQSPAVRGCLEAAGFAARYDRRTQTVTLTRLSPRAAYEFPAASRNPPGTHYGPSCSSTGVP